MKPVQQPFVCYEKAVLFQGAERTNKKRSDIPIYCIMLRYFIEKAINEWEFWRNDFFFGFFQKITCLKVCGVLN